MTVNECSCDIAGENLNVWVLACGMTSQSSGRVGINGDMRAYQLAPRPNIAAQPHKSLIHLRLKVILWGNL